MRLATLRQWHSYIGVLIAPSVLFFALTGALQLFSLHEAHDDYQPAPLIEALGKVHKDQVFEMPEAKKPAPEAQKAAPAKADADDDHGHDADHDGDHDADHDADHHETAAPAPAAHGPDAAQPRKVKHKKPVELQTEILKWTFLFVSIGLVLSTSIGLWMALAHGKRKGVLWTLLVLGAAAPVALLLLA